MDMVITQHATPWGHKPTFAGVPEADIHKLDKPDIVIIGSPIDWGATHRPGARFGPAAIRGGDYLELNARRPHLPTGIDPLKESDVFDVGDLVLGPGYLERSLELTQQAVAMIMASGARPIILGGDHSITFANATAVVDHYGHGDVALVHFDAHADTAETHFGHLHGHGTPMRRLIESGAVPGHRFAQIGLRGYWPYPEGV
jgi:arginase family enzyme